MEAGVLAPLRVAPAYAPVRCLDVDRLPSAQHFSVFFRLGSAGLSAIFPSQMAAPEAPLPLEVPGAAAAAAAPAPPQPLALTPSVRLVAARLRVLGAWLEGAGCAPALCGSDVAMGFFPYAPPSAEALTDADALAALEAAFASEGVGASNTARAGASP